MTPHQDDDESERPGKVRLDKWLWAARFYKTRALSAEAIAGGKIEVNGERAKRS
jgi:ribosome-associated heat shock protein Hsp15